MGKEFKAIKTFLDKNDPFYYFGVPKIMKEPKYEVYMKYKFLFLTFWEYRATTFTDPKKFLNVVESNY